MERFGVSFSIKQCRNFSIESSDCLAWLLNECGFSRFRLMSYWDELEPLQGVYQFKELDNQVRQVRDHGGVITLCLGARQPRWPENHWPQWAWALSESERTEALLSFISLVVERYKKYDCIESYQLENEALLGTFGENIEINRKRLQREFNLVKKLDPTRPVLMSTSDSWGIPFRAPIPDIIGFSLYTKTFNSSKNRYTTNRYVPLQYQIRAKLISLIWRRKSVIHELQLEPWGPKNIWEMSISEQNKSMSPANIKKNLRVATDTNLYPIDLWGSEWWYWRYINDRNDKIIASVLKAL